MMVVILMNVPNADVNLGIFHLFTVEIERQCYFSDKVGIFITLLQIFRILIMKLFLLCDILDWFFSLESA